MAVIIDDGKVLCMGVIEFFCSGRVKQEIFVEEFFHDNNYLWIFRLYPIDRFLRSQASVYFIRLSGPLHSRALQLFVGAGFQFLTHSLSHFLDSLLKQPPDMPVIQIFLHLSAHDIFMHPHEVEVDVAVFGCHLVSDMDQLPESGMIIGMPGYMAEGIRQIFHLSMT